MPTLRMNLPDTSKLTTEKKVEVLENVIIDLISRLTWITAKLDSQNVKRLDTNETVIKSADGTTEIAGPVLVQKDAAGTMRLRQGYDTITGNFIYALFNAAGVQTVGIDSNGNATYTGTITGSTVTGGTIQTAASGSSRIVITGNTLKTYYHNGVSEVLQGIAWGVGAGQEYGDTYFYDSGDLSMIFYNQPGNGFQIKAAPSMSLFLGAVDTTTYGYGAWDFGSASAISGLKTGITDGHYHSVTIE
jgi:hypothetical protein